MSNPSPKTTLGTTFILIAASAPAPVLLTTVQAQAQTQSNCVTMARGSDARWRVTNNCGHPIIGSFCYDGDDYYNCGNRKGGTGTIAPGQSEIAPAPNPQATQWRISYCKRDDFPELCQIQNPWASAANGAALAIGPINGSLAGAAERSASESGPLGLRNMPGTAAAGTAPAVSPATPSNSAAASADVDGNVFGRCISREGPAPSGITFIYYLRNTCQTRISFSYCLRADFEAAGDFNLCTRREYKTHSVAPGESVHFTFSLMPRGTGLTDGRTVTHNALAVSGHACANDNSPGVYFRDGEFLSTGC